MIWKQADGKAAPNAALVIAQAASAEFSVPVGILLGTVERESNFRLGLVSSAGAVGPCQFKPQYAEDYYRYAGFEFDLEGWASIRGLAAVYVYYAGLAAKRHGFAGDDRWRFALLAHRYGQNSTQAKTLDTTGRVRDVEACMERNGLWYSDVAREDNHFDAADVAAKAASWAKSKVGCKYSQPQRDKEGIFDCSSLVARAYAAQGVDWACVGREIPLSCEEVYSDQFELLWPADYAKIGKTFGGESVIAKAKQPGDLQFLCTNRKTGRTNRITHVTMVASATTIVHARGTAYGVRLDDIALYKGKVCAVCRYNPDAPLRQGMRGLRVKALQDRLNAVGAKLDVDGVYGSKTAAAVKKYKEGLIKMDVLVSVLAIASPVASILFAWLTFGRNRKQDAQEAAGSLAMMQSDIGYIKAGNDDIKRQLEAQEKNMSDVRERLTRVEVSAERAHNRLNRLEKHEDNAGR